MGTSYKLLSKIDCTFTYCNHLTVYLRSGRLLKLPPPRFPKPNPVPREDPNLHDHQGHNDSIKLA